MTNEQTSISTAGSGQLRTLAVRISEDLRAQLDIVAQLTGRSTTEEIRLALEHWIEKAKSDPAIQKKAEAIRAEIEREAQTRRNAIAAIFGDRHAEHREYRKLADPAPRVAVAAVRAHHHNVREYLQVAPQVARYSAKHADMTRDIP